MDSFSAASAEILLDRAFYLDTYPDIRDAGCDPLEHFVSAGRLEYRLPRAEAELVAASGLFDPEFYLFYYEDVRRAGVEPLGHFLCSSHERRRPNIYFDTEWYYRQYGEDYAYSPLTHYLLIGEPRGCQPCRYFEPDWYRHTYALGADTNALAHYLHHRKSQTYAPNPHFDVAKYVRQAGLSLRPQRDPFLHQLATHSQARQGSKQALLF